jgi:DNA repair protein RadC
MESDKAQYELPVVSVRLVREPGIRSGHKISSTESAKEVIKALIADSDREMFCVLNLKTNGEVINMNVASIGCLNSAQINPREVYKSSILSNAAAVILFHNHPSGSIEPSKEDYVTSLRLVECGELLGIKVLDNIIVGAGNEKSYSFYEHGELYKTYNQIEYEREEQER